MERAVAQIIAMTAARCSGEIGDLALLVKEHCDSAEHKALSLAIGRAVYELRATLMGKVFELVPGLEQGIRKSPEQIRPILLPTEIRRARDGLWL